MESTERGHETDGAHAREDDPDGLVTVMRILNAGLLEADAGEIRDQLVAGDCLVTKASGRVVSALVLDGDYVEAVAISPSRHGRGVGTQLVHAALDRRGRLVVDFDGGIKPFYEPFGFDIEDRSDDEGRFRGILRDEWRPRRRRC